MDEDLVGLVRRRALDCCEYCRMPQPGTSLPHEIDHIIAMKHGGLTGASNLALACFPCNHHKGPNIAGVDPLTKQIVPLFHPRHDRWEDHFDWHGPTLVGRTPAGRATIQVLAINHPDYIAVREALIAEGAFPA